MGFFERLLNIGGAKAEEGLQAIEDRNAVPLITKKLNDLEKQVSGFKSQLVDIKASALELGRQLAAEQQRSESMLAKAKQLLENAKASKISQSTADSNSALALAEKKKADVKAAELKVKYDSQQAKAATLESKITKIEEYIKTNRDDLVNLRATDDVNKAIIKLDEQMTGIDLDGEMAAIERMKGKVAHGSAKVEILEEMAQPKMTAEQQIDAALAQAGQSSVDDDLAQLKQQMGIQ